MSGVRFFVAKNPVCEKVFTGFVSAMIFAFSVGAASAKPPVGRSWPAAKRHAIDKIDHTPFSDLLKKYVDADGYVDYGAWKNSAGDRRRLHAYLAELGRADTNKRSSIDVRLAFWINAYNAVTLEGILQVYPTTSIRNHTARFVGYNIWKELPLHVGSEQYSLEQIEHEVLRKMNEPLIHFGIVCASIGCPRLRQEAYTEENVRRHLTDNARDFFSRPKNVRADTRDGVLHLSEILSWFGSDFGSTERTQLEAIRPYLPTSAKPLASNPNTRVRFLDYNWNLNDQSKKPRDVSRF